MRLATRSIRRAALQRAFGLGLGLWLLAFAGHPLSAQASIASATADLEAGRADQATAGLNALLQANPRSGPANNLLCRVEFALQKFNEAAGHCEKAVAAEPGNAVYHLWFGRALGERASHASFTSAFGLARHTREEFETATKLDPKYGEALSDLGEFMTEAPGVVGGGIDKAQAIATQLDSVDPARAHLLRGLIAEKQKDPATAEREIKAATTGPRPAVPWMNLASFYRRHERWTEMDAAINSGIAAVAREKHSAIALFNAASILGRSVRNLPLAIKLYEQYLASPDKSEEAPAFDALTRLAKVRKASGDSVGAQRDLAAALALAHDYKPAQEAKL